MMIRIAAYRFAEKMKKIMMTSIAVFLLGSGCLAQDKASVGMDIMPLINTGSINISGGYGFSRKWSASFSAGIALETAGRTRNKEYEEHLAELDILPHDRQRHDGSFSISLEYWPDGTYEGFFMGAGCRYAVGSPPECIIDIGYSMPVWKGLSSMLSYGTKGFRLGFRWTIKTERT